MHPGRDLSAIFADYDNDGYLDLFITNSQANRLYRNAGNGSFVDVGVSAGVDTASGAMSAKFADFDIYDIHGSIVICPQNLTYPINVFV